ncbi:MAG TPA: hypothetical protein PLF86_03095, partial [Candidatus Moranbacteria bacterium]|nr:hypothetical protein [Candidatus Moranbacteria bacterium]
MEPTNPAEQGKERWGVNRMIDAISNAWPEFKELLIEDFRSLVEDGDYAYFEESDSIGANNIWTAFTHHLCDAIDDGDITEETLTHIFNFLEENYSVNTEIGSGVRSCIENIYYKCSNWDSV